MDTAKKNSTLFESVFGGKCVPTDSARNFSELKEFKVHIIIITPYS